MLQSIRQVLPNESFVYVGDTEHLPYGDKSSDLIKRFSLNISSFLVSEFSCKAIVIACNTASAVAYTELRNHWQGAVPVINVIDPMVEYVIGDASISCVGIIGTKATIGSGVYQEKFDRRRSDLEYRALATPLLAPMIEEGFHNSTISNAVLHEYLGSEELRGIDALILGCTHYPLIKKEIEDFYLGRVKVIDSAALVAKKLRDILEKESLLHSGKKSDDLFYITDYSKHFERTARLFYGEQVNLQNVKIHIE